MASIIFRLSAKQIQGKSELLLRFYAPHGVDLRGRSRIYVPPADWDDKKQRLTIPRRVTPHTKELTALQQQIDDLRNTIMNQYMHDINVNKSWLDNLIMEFHNVRPADIMLVADMVEPYIRAKNLQPATARQYRVVEGMLRRYGKRKKALFVGKVDTADIESFVAFLRCETMTNKHNKETVVRRSQNTLNSKLRRLRAVFHWLVETGQSETNPFDRYKIPSDVYGTPTFLTLEERDTIYNTHFDNQSLETQKDIFVFQCHIGCRVSDLRSLTTDNLTDDGFIQYIQHKLRTSNPVVVRVPLTDTAKEIIDKYKGQTDGRLLPFISQDKYNDAIKKVLKAAGITRTVLILNKQTYEEEPHQICDIAASHLARRTFMGNMFKKVKSERIVSSFTGHVPHSKAFARYTDVDDDMKKEVIQTIE